MSINGIIATRMQRFQLILEKGKFSNKPHQIQGVEWCLRKEILPFEYGLPKVRGGLIADEMGLGKTIMMIGLMIANYVPKTLIILPPVLIKQWYNEIYKCTGHKAFTYYGKDKKNIVLLKKSTIVIASYNSLLDNNCALKDIIWNRIIYDEAHHLCNQKTKIFQQCIKLKSCFRWLVTGTPIQNKKSDFNSLCKILGFQQLYILDDLNKQKITQNFILMRTKVQIGIELPQLNKYEVIVPWLNNSEKKISEEIHSLLPRQTGVDVNKQKKIAELFGAGGSLLAILRARQSCVLPKLMQNEIKKNYDKRYLEVYNKTYESILENCSKIDCLINFILRKKDNDKGKIIFCHFIQEIDTIEERLLKVGVKKIIKYDGRNCGKRELLNEKADVLILQIKSGCEGLNLQKNYSEIYFVSPSWNPSVEDQAVARCHRIGQENPVDVYKFVMEGFDSMNVEKTLDKYINEVQDFKRILFKEILGEN
jgi:SNF2 family DNA or RNA helicase